MEFLNNYLNNKNASASKDAFNYLIRDLLQNNLTGESKSRTLSGLNMEDNQPNTFVPSMIYIMMYCNPEKPYSISGNGEFYDLVPLIYCIGNDVSSVSGINLNYIPNNIRARFLDVVSENRVMENSIKTGNSSFKIDEKLGVSLMTQGPDNILQYIKSQTKCDLSACVRKYNKKNIINSRLVEYDMWDCIPNLNFNDAIRGIKLADIQMDVANTANK